MKETWNKWVLNRPFDSNRQEIIDARIESVTKILRKGVLVAALSVAVWTLFNVAAE